MRTRKTQIRAGLTEETAAELEEHGITEHRAIEPIKSESLTANDVVVCMRWHEGEPLNMPGNLITDCAWGCGSKIQHRPHVPAAPAKVCMPCILQRRRDGEH